MAFGVLGVFVAVAVLIIWVERQDPGRQAELTQILFTCAASVGAILVTCDFIAEPGFWDQSAVTILFHLALGVFVGAVGGLWCFSMLGIFVYLASALLKAVARMIPDEW